jgi:predicted CXXCH cytochrome family protein
MAHSLIEVLASAVETVQQEASFDSSPGCAYEVRTTENSVTHREVLRDRDGELIYEQTVPVDYVVGSGKRGHSYLINREGLLFMSPITWYTEGQRFDLSPGYAAHSHPRFGRRLSDGCLACHSGLMARDATGPQRFSATPFIEASIGCERCHGPGRKHVEFQTSFKNNRSALISTSDPIVNPSQLSSQLQDDICNQCHIQGIKRILRYGRTEYDFRPGDRLIDIWATFVSGDRIDASGQATRAVSQVEQMHLSQCSQKSNGRLTCTSCHDPHRSPSPEQRVAFYRSRCLECHVDAEASCTAPHDERHAVQDSCIDCHMPRLKATDVPHTSQTDHRILRTSSAGLRETNLSSYSTGMDPELFQDAESDLSPRALQRVRGLLLAHMANSSGNPQTARQALGMLEPLPDSFPDDTELLDALGSVSYLVGEYPSARRYWLKLNGLQSSHESAVEGLMLVERRKANSVRALEYVDRLIELNPWREDIFHQKSHILNTLGRDAESIRAAEQGLELNPGSRSILLWLIEICEESGEKTKAEKYRDRLDRISRVRSDQPP